MGERELSGENNVAYVRMQRGKWRAEIEKFGVRKSRSFNTREAAEAWGLATEDLIAREGPAVPLPDKLMPARVLRALSQIEYSKAEILRCASRHRSHCGVYFLVAGDEVVYVGQSVDVFARIARHKRDGRQFDGHCFIECPQEKLDEVESRYIVAFMPWMNFALGHVPRAAQSVMDCRSDAAIEGSYQLVQPSS